MLFLVILRRGSSCTTEHGPDDNIITEIITFRGGTADVLIKALED